MVTDKQINKNKTKQKGKNKKGGLLEEQNSSAILCRAWPQTRKMFTEDLIPRANCVKYDCEFSASKLRQR